MKREADAKGENSVIKGCQKRMIKIKCPKSEVFEEAYFILREDGEESGECDMVREAERLLSENRLRSKRRFSFGWDEVLFFAAGLLISALFFLVLHWFA